MTATKAKGIVVTGLFYVYIDEVGYLQLTFYFTHLVKYYMVKYRI